jgi:hypothetical protein
MAWREYNLNDGIVVSVSTYYEVIQPDPTGDNPESKIRKKTTTLEWRGLTLEAAQAAVTAIAENQDAKITPIGGGGYNLSLTYTENLDEQQP